MKELGTRPNNLTIEPQTPYSKYGVIFMEGKPDMSPQNQRSSNPEHAEKVPQASKLGVEKPVSTEADIIALEENKDLSVDIRRVLEEIKQQDRSPQGQSSMLEVARALERLPKPSIFGNPVVKVQAEVMPFIKRAEEITRKKSEEFGGSKAVNLNPVNVAAVTDPELKLIGERINRNIGLNQMDYQRMKDTIIHLEAARKNLPANSPDQVWAKDLYEILDVELVLQRQQAGEVDWGKVKEELRAATIAGNLSEIEGIVKKYYDFNERIDVRGLVEVSLSDGAITSGIYGYALEYVMETIINVADLNPLGHIPNPTFTQSENISKLVKATLDLDQDEDKEFYKYLSELQERRGLSHELYKSMSTRGAYEKYVGEHLKNDGFHYLENEIVGVSETQGLWEKVMARKKSKNKQILSQAEFDNVHEEVRELFKKNANLDADGTSQKLKKRLKIHKPGQHPLEIERRLREWEINRAAVVGRSVAHVSGRAITYGMLGDLPTIDDELYDSMNAEYVARITGSMQVSAKRFLSSSASKEYIELWVKNKLQIAKENGSVFGEGVGEAARSLYGQKLDSAVYLDTGVPDLKTHGWRNRRTQLKNSKFAKIAEHDPDDLSKNTIGDYLDREWKKVGDEVKRLGLDHLLDNIQGALTPEESAYLNDKDAIRISKDDRIKNVKFCRNIKETMLQQRLYLSALLREGHLTPMLREEIWKKVAEFLPSRIAAFFPEESRNIEIEIGGELHEVNLNDEEWKELSNKLFMAEMDRTREQQEKVKLNDFSEVDLSRFYDNNGITTDTEKACIEAIIKLGKNKSKMLSNMIFPQSAFLDDAPEPEWMNLGKETVGRLLVNDYEGYSTANNERNAIIGNPSMRLGESAEHLVKAKDGYASPIGPEGAQDRLEADILTRYDLYSMDRSSKWGLYSINRWLRKPTSLIEKSNVDANISMDEKAVGVDIDFLSQRSVVSNDRARLDFLGHTQSERIKIKKKARIRDLWLRNLRLILMLFPGAFGAEFIKMIAPDLLKTK